MMTIRERVLAVFQGEQPEVVPWLGDLTYWAGAMGTQGKLPDRYKGEGIVQLHKDLRCGIYVPYFPGSYAVLWRTEFYGYEVESRSEGGITRRTIKTPVGTLEEELRYCPESFSWGYTKRMVSTPQDLEVVQYIEQHKRVIPDPAGYERMDRLYGDQGVAIPCMPRTPYARLLVEYAGIVNTSYLIADAPEEFQRTLDILRETDDPYYEVAAKCPAKFIFIADNLSSEAVSPPLFRKYSLPYFQKRIRQLHDAGKWVLTHVDGTLRGFLPVLRETGIDCIESIVPAPVGDLPVEAIRREAGRDLILWGWIPGALFSPTFPEAQFREYVKNVILTLKPNPRFVLAVADQVPPDAVIERVPLVAEIADQYGAATPRRSARG